MPVINVTLNSSSASASASSFQGDWNANTNTPTLDNTDTSKGGFMYKVSVGGSTDFGAGSITFEAGDIVINNGSVWSKIDATDAVISVAGKSGVVILDKTDVGLPNVDNTSDANKPISSATLSALAGKVDVDGAKVLSDNNYTTTEKNKLAGIANGAQVNTVTSVASKTGAVSLVKADVGLSNVDNTADTAKPVSTAQQTALNLKANLASPTFTGTVSGVTKTHVGLGNVANVDTTNASNISSGTLPTARLSSTFQVRVGNLTRVIGEDGLPPPTITADTTGTYVDYTVSGAAIGYRVHVVVRSPGVSNLIASGECTGTDTVRVYFCTTSGSVAIEEKMMDLLVYKDNS